MKISHSPSQKPARQAAGAPQPPAQGPVDSFRPDPAPEPPPRFRDSARHWRRDALLGVAGAGSCLLPGGVGAGTGVVFGGLSAVSGLGELQEGIQRKDGHEVLDGAVHLIAGGGMMAAGLYHSTALGPFLAAGSGVLLAAKGIYDNPIGVARFAGQESRDLLFDSGKSVAAGARSAWNACFPRTPEPKAEGKSGKE